MYLLYRSISFSSPYHLHHVRTNPVKHNRTGILLPDAFDYIAVFVYDSVIFNYCGSNSILSIPENEPGNDCGAAAGRVGIFYYSMFIFYKFVSKYFDFIRAYG